VTVTATAVLAVVARAEDVAEIVADAARAGRLRS
jgi:hypothetical protein